VADLFCRTHIISALLYDVFITMTDTVKGTIKEGKVDDDDDAEAVISFDDDDDDMLDLFSFGADPSSSAPGVPNPGGQGPDNDDTHGKERAGVVVDFNDDVMKSSTLFSMNNSNHNNIDDDQNDDDSFIELLDQQKEITVVDASDVQTHRRRDAGRNSDDGTEESGMQEMLDWLDDDDEMTNARLAAAAAAANGTGDDAEEEELDFMPPTRPPTLAQSIPKPTPPPPRPKEFDSLQEAVQSHESSIYQIRRLLEKERFKVDSNVRPHLWAKVICGKTLQETLSSSIADSFQQWEARQQQQKQQQQPPQPTLAVVEEVVGSEQDGKLNTAETSLVPTNKEATDTNEEISISNEDSQPQSSSKDLQSTNLLGIDNEGTSKVQQAQQLPLPAQDKQQTQQQQEWLEQQSQKLAHRIAMVLDGNVQSAENDLYDVLANHCYTGMRNVTVDSSNDDSSGGDEGGGGGGWNDPLLPPVACAILSAGVPKAAAAVMISQIIPSFMPILALTNRERHEVAEILHRQFYLLASYHLPLLVWHLDRYMPEWYKWPPLGRIPQSWLISHLAGEVDGGPMMNPRGLLCLWDLILTSSNNSLRFFLVLAILDTDAERLLLLTGNDLKEAFHLVVTYSSPTGSNDTLDGFAIDGGDEETTTSEQASRWVQEWSDRALALWEETPLSVTQKLKVLEDEAVSEALVARQKAKEERMRLKLEADAKAQQEAMEAERERRSDEARTRLTRARLVAFYRQYNAGKENNIDKIMETFEGRYDVLDAKLKLKYGVGFNPALKPKPPQVNKNAGNLLSSINVGFGTARMTFAKRKDDQEWSAENHTTTRRVVEVSAREVLPIICWSKTANQMKLSKLKKSSKLENEANTRMPLKFYLIDSRPEEATLEQGRFPTSVNLCPDMLLDYNEVKRLEDIFEPLRGSVHICVMGEGYSALPDLYGHKMTKGLADFIREDEARVNECAVFFLSRGFPFVSVVSGGFAAAHAFLCREGHTVHLRANDVLADYNPESSLFGQFEKLHSASGREKAQRSLQNLFDSSMTVITKNSMRLETLASELSNTNMEDNSNQKVGQKNVVQRLFRGTADEKQGVLIETKEESRSLAVESSDNEENPGRTRTDASVPPSPVKGKEENVTMQQKSESSAGQQKANPFSGLGAALNNSLKVNKASTPSTAASAPAPAPAPVRNPFAMFGNLGSTQNPTTKAEKKGPGMTNHFAGFNQLRKNTMARIRVPGNDNTEGAAIAKPEKHGNTTSSSRVE
jgi:hypothetical protein